VAENSIPSRQLVQPHFFSRVPNFFDKASRHRSYSLVKQALHVLTCAVLLYIGQA